MDNETYIEAGEIVNAHGVRGEVKILPWVDSPEFLQSFRTVYIDGQSYPVVSSYIHKGCVIVSLAGVDTVDSAVLLKRKTIWIRRADADLPEGSFFYADILGANVFTEDGTLLGTLTEVLDKPGNMVYVVHGEVEHLIPAVPAFILRTDLAKRELVVRLIPGM